MPIQSASARIRKTPRKSPPEPSGSSASFCAIWTWKGLMGLNADPTNAAPALIATATSGVKPTVRVRMSRTGISGMISSCMFSTTPPVAKKIETMGMTSRSRPLSVRTSDVTPRRSAPVSSTTVNAPPMRNTRKITSAASAMPRGSATIASKRLTGARSTAWYVPATTTERPVASSSDRSNWPAGKT